MYLKSLNFDYFCVKEFILLEILISKIGAKMNFLIQILSFRNRGSHKIYFTPVCTHESIPTARELSKSQRKDHKSAIDRNRA